MTVAVDILHVAVVCPLVRHIECGRDGAPVGVTADRVEDALVKLLVQVIEAVVEGEDDELRRLRSSEVAGDLGAAAVAVRQCAVLPRALAGRLPGGRRLAARRSAARQPLRVAAEVDVDLAIGGQLLHLGRLLHRLKGVLGHLLHRALLVVVVLELVVDRIVPLGVVEDVTVDVVLRVVQVFGLPGVTLQQLLLNVAQILPEVTVTVPVSLNLGLEANQTQVP